MAAAAPGQGRALGALRAVLVLLLAASLALSATSLWRVWNDPGGRWLAVRSAEAAAPALERALARHATPTRLAGRIDAHLAATPRNWEALDALDTLAAERGVTLPPATAHALSDARAADHTPWARAERCGGCLMDLAACDVRLILTCRLPLELTPVGDVAGLARQGANQIAGAPVDRIDLVLSLAGLGALAAAPSSLGASLPIRSTAATMKILHRSGRLAPGLAAPLTRAARDGVDWSGLAAARSLPALRATLRPDAIAPAQALLADAARLRSAAGARAALHMTGAARGPTELAAMARGAEVLGPRTLGSFETLGRGRFLRATLRLTDAARHLAAAALLLVVSAAGLGASALLHGTRRGLKRAARA